ncbi:MAG: serine/threonine-protein kinase, partial [Rubripirellula sp.]
MNSESSNYDFPDPPQQDGEIGRLGPYRVLGQLGTGGMGEVFRARDSRLKRTVALKLMKKKLAATPASRKRFIEEARSMAAVHHDNVATIFEVGVQDGVPFMAMELLHGKSLADAMKEQGTFAWADVLRVAKEVSLGLAAAHQSGLVHRDIKPANIWLEEPSGRAKILDFGLAIAGNAFDPFAARGTVVGSPGYLAPEQARNESVDDRTDLYSLGVVLYVMCTGKLPLSSGTISGQLIAIICHPPNPLQNWRPDVPKPLCDLIHQLLRKEARDRPESAARLALLIDDVANRCATESQQALQIVTETPKPRLPTPSQPVSKADAPNEQKATRWPLLVAGVACLAGIAFATWWLMNPDRDANTPVVVAPTPIKPEPTRVTAKSLQPLELVTVTEGTRTTIRGQAARYRVQIRNDAKNDSEDPRQLNAKSKVVAQLVTLLKQPGRSRVLRPTFPKKIPASQLPRPDSTKDFEVQFLTSDLAPETYQVEIQLQTPGGSVVATVEDRLTIKENLQESDLLGFEILRTHQGNGADSYVRSDASDDYG